MMCILSVYAAQTGRTQEDKDSEVTYYRACGAGDSVGLLQVT